MLVYADGVDSARSAPAAVAEAAGVDDREVLVGWTPESRSWFDSPDLRGRTTFPGYGAAGAVAAGRLRYLPVRLSAVPNLVRGVLRAEVAVVVGVRRGADLVFGGSVGWGPAAAAAADAVVVEIDEGGVDLGGPPIPGRVVATVTRPPGTVEPPTPRPPDAVDRAIGAHVVSVLPDEPTLQFGPGGVADAIVETIAAPVRIWSGLVSDAVAALERRGLLLGAATTAYTWGGPAVTGLAEAGKLRLVSLEETHDLTVLSGFERLVACNTALQVGLDGAVNVERVGARWVAGIGGHADFCLAASRSVGGLSVIALRSTTKRGASTIVPRVATVSTARSDVDIVVTEHGVADLRGVDDAERSRRIAQIAAPEHRASLTAAAENPEEDH